MANFNEDVSITGILTIQRAFERTGIEVPSIESVSNAGVHINTINTNGTMPYVWAVAAGPGIQGESQTATAVTGISQSGFGMLAQSNSNSGIVATSSNGQAITAFSDNGIGIFVQAGTFAGVFNGAFVVNKGPGPKTPDAPNPAADINGSIVINDGSLFVNTGDVIVVRGDVKLEGADCAEEFDVTGLEYVEMGMVMVIDEKGRLRVSEKPYDKRVAGVVSGAGKYKPGIVLDRHSGEGERTTIALIGKVYCKVDAENGAIEVGDLLTTSSTFGHAMKASDPLKAFGAVIGKALQSCPVGQGLIPILVALQ